MRIYSHSLATNTTASIGIGDGHGICSCTYSDAISCRASTPQIRSGPIRRTKLCCLSRRADKIITRNCTNRRWTKGNYFTTNTATTISISDRYSISSCCVYGNTIGGRASAPYIRRSTCWRTKLCRLTLTNGSITRDRTNRRWTKGNYFTTNTATTISISDRYSISSCCVYGNTIGSCAGTPQIRCSTCWRTKLCRLSLANNIITRNSTNWRWAEGNGCTANTSTTSNISNSHRIGSCCVY